MTKYFKQTTLTSLLTGILCFGLLAVPSQAEACCIYNHTIHPLHVQFNMVSNHDVGPSNKFCTNGKGGNYSIFLSDPYHTESICDGVNIKVDDHGWISVYKKSGGKWKVVSYRKDGSVRATKYMHPNK